MSTKLTHLVNKILNPQKTILLVGNSNEFDFKLIKNMPDFIFFVFVPQGKKWDYSKFIPSDNMITFGNKGYVLFNDISMMIGSHCVETVDFKNTFPYIPLISIFHNEPLPNIPFYPRIERKNYGNLCLSINKKVADAWETNGKIVENFNTKLLVKEVVSFYENSFNKR